MTPPSILRTTLFALGIVVSGACQKDGTTDPSSTSAPSASPASMQAAASLPAAEADDPRVEAAVQDLAERLSLKAEEIQVMEQGRVTWPDGSLGCPEEGQFYLQALTPGVWVILGVGEARYAYHGAEEGPLSYCEKPADPIVPPSQPTD